MGIFDWTKKKASDAKETGKKVIAAEEIKENAVFIGEMAKKLLNPKEVLKDAKQETFLEAKKRLSISEIDLIKNYTNYSRAFYASLIGGMVCLFVLSMNLVNFNIMGIAASLSILAVCAANAFKFSFRAFQIKHQKLCPVKDWLDRPGEWFPKIG